MERNFLEQTRVFGKGQRFPIFINDKDYIIAQIDDGCFASGADCCFVGETAEIAILLKDDKGSKSEGIFDNVELCYSSADQIVSSPDWNLFEMLNSVFKVNFKTEKNVVYDLMKGSKATTKALLVQHDAKKITNFRMSQSDDARKFWNDFHFGELSKEPSTIVDIVAIGQVNRAYSFSASNNLTDVLVVDENFKAKLKFAIARPVCPVTITEVKQYVLDQFESFYHSHKDHGLLIRLGYGVPCKFDSLLHVSVDDLTMKDKKYLLIRLLTPRILNWIRSMMNDSSNYTIESKSTSKSFRQFTFCETDIESLLQKTCQKIQLLQCAADKKTFGLVVHGPEMSGRTTIATLLLDRLTDQYLQVDMRTLLYNSRGMKFEDMKQDFERKIAASLPRRKVAFLFENIEEMSVLGEADSSAAEKQMITHYFKR